MRVLHRMVGEIMLWLIAPALRARHASMKPAPRPAGGIIGGLFILREDVDRLAVAMGVPLARPTHQTGPDSHAPSAPGHHQP